MSEEAFPRPSAKGRRKRIMITAVAAIAMIAGVVGIAAAKGKSKSIDYRFEFTNGEIVEGTASGNTEFLEEAGGSSVDRPSGMTVHVSCSDKFPGGWGEKDGPEQGVDTAWQIESYFIQKGDKTCGTPTPPTTTVPPTTTTEPPTTTAEATTTTVCDAEVDSSC
jgi:hypothetical protein